jgi:hypothetical protein
VNESHLGRIADWSFVRGSLSVVIRGNGNGFEQEAREETKRCGRLGDEKKD